MRAIRRPPPGGWIARWNMVQAIGQFHLSSSCSCSCLSLFAQPSHVNHDDLQNDRYIYAKYHLAYLYLLFYRYAHIHISRNSFLGTASRFEAQCSNGPRNTVALCGILSLSGTMHGKGFGYTTSILNGCTPPEHSFTSRRNSLVGNVLSFCVISQYDFPLKHFPQRMGSNPYSVHHSLIHPGSCCFLTRLPNVPGEEQVTSIRMMTKAMPIIAPMLEIYRTVPWYTATQWSNGRQRRNV